MQAQIVSDPSAHPSHHPQILSAGQNIPVITIQTPNGAGVSINHYSQFDVPTQGAVLNNSRVDVKSDLAGQIKGNASLAGGTANVILNQVNAPNPSHLKGFLEVAGDVASVVVANPSGIMCDGCGFINTPHATLTTGKPLLSGSGALEGYRVEGGTVTFQGKGLNAQNTDYTDVLARAVQVNAQVQAGKELRVVAGRNTVTRHGVSTPTATPLEDRSRDKPEFALDVAALGGMYAGHIHMVGTEAGVGVRNAGTLSADTGDFVLHSDGRFENTGTLQSAKNTHITTKGDMRSSGKMIASSGAIHVDAKGHLTLGGPVDAKQNVALKAKRMTLQKNSELLAREGTLQLLATDIQGQGSAKAKHKIILEAESLDFSQSQFETQDMTFTTRSGTGTMREAHITVGGRFSAHIAGNFITDNATLTASKIEIAAQNMSNVGGTLRQTGVEDFQLTNLSFLDNAQGTIESKGSAFTLEVDHLINTDGTLFHDGEGIMTVKGSQDLASTRGNISSKGDVVIEAPHMDNEGGLVSGLKSLWLKTKSLINRNTTQNQKGLSSQGAITLTLDDTLNNTFGLIRSGGALKIRNGLLLTQDGTLSTDSSLDIRSAEIKGAGGIFKALDAFIVQTQNHSFDVTKGSLYAGGEMVIASGDLTTSGANVFSQKSMSLNVDTLHNTDGTLTAQENIDIVTSGALINTQDGRETADSAKPHVKGIVSGGALTITSGGHIDNSRSYMMSLGEFSVTGRALTNVSGILKAEKNLTIDTYSGSLDNSHGTLWSQEALNITSGALTNTDGNLSTNADLKITSGAIQAYRGMFQSLGAMTLNTQGQSFDLTEGSLVVGTFAPNTGLVIDGHDLEITSGDLTADKALLIGSKNITLNVGTFTHQHGEIVANKALRITASQVDNTHGRLIGESLTVDSTKGPLINTYGTLMAEDGSLSLSAQNIRNDAGLIHGTEDVTLTALNKISNTRTSKAHQATTPLSKGVMGRAVTLKTQTVDNTQGLISATTDAQLDLSKTLINTEGDLEGARVAITDRDEGLRDLTVENTRGRMRALEHLTLEAATLAGYGALTSHGTMNIDLLGDYTYTGGWTVHRDLTFSLTGGLTNQNILESGGKFTLTAASLHNQTTGALVGRSGLKITTGEFTNTGLVNTTEGVIKAHTLTNTGGRMYGDRLAIQATDLTNGAHNNRAGTIATRSGDLHLGVGILTNEKGALIQSLGHLFIGGSLDDNRVSQGKATHIKNLSARIEATENLFLHAHELLNKNMNLRHELQTEETFGPKEHLVQDSGWCTFEAQCEHSTYTRVEKPVVIASDPAVLRAGQNLILTVDRGENNASQMSAGLGTHYHGAELQNITPHVTVRQWDGMRTYNRPPEQTWDWRYVLVDHGNKERWTEQPYAPTVTEKTVEVVPPVITLTPHAPIASEGVPSLSTAAVVETESEAVTSTSSLSRDRAYTADVVRAFLGTLPPSPLEDSESAPHGKGSRFVFTSLSEVPGPVNETYTIRTAPFSPDIPTASLFTPRPESTATYLIETDAQFTDRKTWLTSDVQLTYMGLDPATAQKRLGDGFYEQKLVRDQLIKLTGSGRLPGTSDDLTQYASLLASGAVFGKQHNLIPGVALTAAQMAKLTSPIVWLVKRSVRLKDGSTQEVLVPQVYAVVRSGALRGDGALLAGQDVQIATSGAVMNTGGTIAGTRRTEIRGHTIANLLGRLGNGGQTALTAQQDIANIGGTIHGGSVGINAGRDFVSATTTKSTTSQSGSGSNFSQGRMTNVDRHASVTATDSAGTLQITSGRDTLLVGNEIQNKGTGETTLTAGRHLTADTVQTNQERQTRFHAEKETLLAKTSVSGTDHTVETQSVGTQIVGGRDVTLSAGSGIAKDASLAGDGSALGHLTLKNAQIASVGKTTLNSTGTTTFVEDTETHFSQKTNSKVDVLWQKQTDTGGHKDTGARTTLTAAGGSTTTAGGGVVNQAATLADKTWNEKKEGLTPTGSALVGLFITGATFLSGGTAAGAFGILNPIGAATVNAGAASFGSQLVLGTINNKGDVGKALEQISAKQIAVSMGSAGISAGVISAFSPTVVPRLDPNFHAGAGAGTSFSDMGLTQSASFARMATQATSLENWALGFVSRMPAHGIQTITNMGANAILSDGDVKAVRNAALGSLATIVGTESTLPLGQAYHAGQMNPFVHKVLHGGIGAGTAAISGGNVWAGAAGAVAGELAGEIYLATQTPTLHNANHLTRQAANIGRVAGGLAGLVAGQDPNTGANTGTIASENNAAFGIAAKIAAALTAAMAGSSLYEAGGNPDLALQKLGSGDHPLAKAMADGTTEVVTLSAEKYPEETKLAFQVLSVPGQAKDFVVTFADQATGKVVSKAWGLLSLETQNRLKGAQILALSISSATVSQLSNAAKFRKPVQPTISLSAEQANQKSLETFLTQNPNLTEKDFKPPYMKGTRAREFVLTEDRTFVRVHQDGQPGSEWIMRPEQFGKLKLEAERTNVPLDQLLKDRFSLPELPTHLSEVHVPAGTKFRVGTAAPQADWGGKGGAIQYEMEERLPRQNYKLIGPIENYMKRISQQ